MAFNFNHTASGDITLRGANLSASVDYVFPKPNVDGEEATLMVAGGLFGIDAISGLQSELDSKVYTGDIGTAYSYNCGTQENELLYINGDGFVPDSTLPHGIVNDAYVVNEYFQLTSLTDATTGDIATVIGFGEACTYILTGSYSNSSNWTPLVSADTCILSVNTLTGEVCITAANTYNSGQTFTIDYSVEDLSSNYISTLEMNNEYTGVTDFDTTVSNYLLSCDFTKCANNLITSADSDNCLSTYYTQTSLLEPNLLNPYLLKCSTGNAATLNTGLSMDNLLVVESDGYIHKDLVPAISLNDTFVISSESQLTGLSAALIGDVAIDTVAHKNYILSICGDNAYQTQSNWVELAETQGCVSVVNNQVPDGLGNVTIDSTHIEYTSGYSITNSITDSDASVTCLENNYVTSTMLADGNLCCYITTGAFYDIDITKSVTGHGHLDTCEIVGFTSCSNLIKGFEHSNLIDLADCYNVSLSIGNVAETNNSILLGNDSKSKLAYSLVQAPGSFSVKGDAQSTSVVSHVQTTNDSSTTILQVPMSEGSAGLVKSKIVAKSAYDTGIYASFAVEGAVAREIGQDASVLNLYSTTTFSSSNENYSVELVGVGSNVRLKVVGLSGETINWVSNTELLAVVGSTGEAGGGVGTYFDGTTNQWYSLARWYTDAGLNYGASMLPNADSDVVMLGSTAACVNLDNAFWIQPNSIDTTAVTDPKGICFVSSTGAIFNGTIYGNATFAGAVFN